MKRTNERTLQHQLLQITRHQLYFTWCTLCCEKVCVCVWERERVCVCVDRIKTATCNIFLWGHEERERESLKGLQCQRGSTGLSLSPSLSFYQSLSLSLSLFTFFYRKSEVIDLLSWWGHVCIAASRRRLATREQQQFHLFSFFLFFLFLQKNQVLEERESTRVSWRRVNPPEVLIFRKGVKNENKMETSELMLFSVSHDCLLEVEKLEKSCRSQKISLYFPSNVKNKHLQKSSVFRISN